MHRLATDLRSIHTEGYSRWADGLECIKTAAFQYEKKNRATCFNEPQVILLTSSADDVSEEVWTFVKHWLHNPCCGGGGGGGGWGGDASKQRREARLAHKCADGLYIPCRLGSPQHFRAGHAARSGPQVDGSTGMNRSRALTQDQQGVKRS